MGAQQRATLARTADGAIAQRVGPVGVQLPAAGGIHAQAQPGTFERGARVLAVLGHPPGAEELVRAVAERGDIEVFLLGEHPPEGPALLGEVVEVPL